MNWATVLCSSAMSRTVLAVLAVSLRESYFVHDLKSLNGFLLCHADEFLLERAGPVSRVEEEEARVWIDAQKGCDVDIVRERGRKPHKADNFLCLLHAANCAGHNTFEDRPALVV
ncbi:hypothetical protein BC937DRAFT_88634 [Endogone sp. FLAS-F59071]|nr:hypothetical protein BC937DRAFT_88634 [Endogone sp. FLAS-F59071]|eukprot:RUS18548.1 hypothetical protein BC937DRAFT_88634 [Endogone sp. FLAS-F59071]